MIATTDSYLFFIFCQVYDQETNENDYLNGDGDKIDPKNSPLFNLLDLVDKYWNGTKSLHKNFKFLGLANQALSLNEHKLYETSQLSVFQNQINNLKDENSRLGQTIKDLRVNRDQGILEIEKKNRQLIDENVSIFLNKNKTVLKNYISRIT